MDNCKEKSCQKEKTLLKLKQFWIKNLQRYKVKDI